jgi:hypothetical protein
MNMPGFQAEASLYQTMASYRGDASSATAMAGQVVPQRRIDITINPFLSFRYLRCLAARERCFSSCGGSDPLQVCRVGCLLEFNRCIG